jgi:hypothetical protein
MKKNKKLWPGMLAMVLAVGITVVGCGDGGSQGQTIVFDNNIYSVSILLSYGDEIPKVGKELSTTVKNISGDFVSGVAYQWKRADSQYSTFVNINGALSSKYTTTIDDTDKYLKVEVINSSTTAPVLSSAVGPVDGNQVVKPTADPASGEVVSGQEVTLSSITTGVTIRYTLNGTTPTSSSDSYSDYSKPKITNNCTLKAIAIRYGMVDSEILSVTYTVVAAPSFSSVTSSASIFTDGIYSVAYGNDRFVAGGNTRIAYSTNGTTWTSSTGISSSWIVNGITYGTGFVAVGIRAINYSSDGASWNIVTDTTFGTSFINNVAYGGGGYVAVGEDGKMAYSTDGTSWTAVTNSTFGTSTIYGITYAAGKFVAVGAGGKMAYSTNGTNWTAVTDSTFGTSTINSITYGGTTGKEIFIAVGNSLSSYYFAYSADGVTWTRVSQSFYGGLFSGLNSVAWGGNKFVAVASSGVMYFSLDGTYWAQIDGGIGVGKSQFDTNSSSSINDIVYGGGRFLAVGSKYAGGNTTGEMAISN